MECFVRKLKTIINDDSLPVLETMQQFTLDAIVLSGNNGMTDSQKDVLNHFFYEVGAIENNALWGKMKCILLPMICNDVVAKSMVDYKNGVTISPSNASNLSFDTHHGLIATGYNSTNIINGSFNGSNFNLSVIQVEMADGIPEGGSSNVCVMVDSGTSSDRTLLNVQKQIDNLYFMNFGLLSPIKTGGYTGNNVYDVAAVTSMADSGNIRVISTQNDIVLSGDATEGMIEARGTEKSYTNGVVRFGVTANLRSYGMIILSEALTDDELAKVMDAAKVLKLAFVA